MKALILHNFNTRYTLTDIEKPVPGDDEVLVKIMASGVNPLDLKIVAQQAAHARPVLPAVLGIDMAGIVETVGKNVKAFKSGDEVYGMTGGIAGVQGSLAEYAAVDSDLLAVKPKNLSMKQAASLPLVFITAWEGLVDRAKISKGKTVLIHGGAGGVGHIAVQMAIAFGARVFATVSDVDFDLIKSYGATPIDYKNSSLDNYVQECTRGEGFDIILDTVGGKVLDDSFKAVKQYTGHVASILGWGNHSLAPLSFKGATYSGVFTLYPLISGRGRKHHGDILREATKMAESNRLISLLSENSYTLETVQNSYDDIATGTVRGKIVIDVQ